jgi:hypothetical protein
MTIIDCTIVNNATGVFTSDAAETRLAGTTISRNTTGIVYNAGGLALSQGNNLIDGNIIDGGTVTITQSVSIIAPPGVYAGISVFSGVGITVTAATDVVTLRGLTINNVDLGARGIVINGAGRLQVADVSVTGFAFEGLDFVPSASGELVVERSNFSGNGSGIVIGPGASNTVNAVIDGVRLHRNDQGIFAFNNVTATVRNSVISANSVTGVGAFPQAAGSNTDVTLESTEISFTSGNGVSVGDPNGTSALTIIGCTIVNNNTGVFTSNAAETRLAGTTISRNTTGIAYATGGLALSQGNNLIDGNIIDGAAPTIVGAK